MFQSQCSGPDGYAIKVATEINPTPEKQKFSGGKDRFQL